MSGQGKEYPAAVSSPGNNRQAGLQVTRWWIDAPRTPEGRQRCAAAKTIHGKETTGMRKERRLASARLAVLAIVGHALGFMQGTRTRGRKPALMSEVECELQAVVRDVMLRQAVKK